MGIRVTCPDCGHKMNLKAFLAGKRGVCPKCDAKFVIPTEDGEGKRPDSDGGKKAEEKPAPGPPASPAPSPSPNPSPSPVAVEDAPKQSAPAPATPQPAPAPQTAPAPQPAPAQSAPSPAPKPAPVQSAPVQSAPAPSPVPQVTPAQPAPAPAPVQSAPDPLAEAPQASWHVRPPSGGQFGPAKADMMRQWISEGRVTPESLVWREGWADWQRADAVLPQLKPTPSPVTPAPHSGGGFIETAPSRPGSGRPVTYRRQNTAGRTVAIVSLCLILLVLLPLLIFVLMNPGWFNG